MKKTKLAVSCALAALATSAADVYAKSKVVVAPAETVQYAEMMPGVSEAPLWGNTNKRHGSLTKFLSGTKVGMHTHTADIKMVVISGTIVTGDADGHETRLGPGSYSLIPGGEMHTTSCAEGSDCVFYSEINGKFDLKMSGAESNPKR